MYVSTYSQLATLPLYEQHPKAVPTVLTEEREICQLDDIQILLQAGSDINFFWSVGLQG